MNNDILSQLDYNETLSLAVAYLRLKTITVDTPQSSLPKKCSLLESLLENGEHDASYMNGSDSTSQLNIQISEMIHPFILYHGHRYCTKRTACSQYGIITGSNGTGII